MPLLPLKSHHIQTSFLVRIKDHKIAGHGGFQRLQPEFRDYLENSGIEEFRIFVISGGSYSTPFEVEVDQSMPPIRGVIDANDTTLSPPLDLEEGYYFLAAQPDLEPWLNAYMGSDRTVHIEVETDLDASKLMLFL